MFTPRAAPPTPRHFRIPTASCIPASAAADRWHGLRHAHAQGCALAASSLDSGGRRSRAQRPRRTTGGSASQPADNARKHAQHPAPLASLLLLAAYCV